jgi:hypothetical protein
VYFFFFSSAAVDDMAFTFFLITEKVFNTYKRHSSCVFRDWSDYGKIADQPMVDHFAHTILALAFRTDRAVHLPPRGVMMPRSFNAAAWAFAEVMPSLTRSAWTLAKSFALASA